MGNKTPSLFSPKNYARQESSVIIKASAGKKHAMAFDAGNRERMN